MNLGAGGGGVVYIMTYTLQCTMNRSKEEYLNNYFKIGSKIEYI